MHRKKNIDRSDELSGSKEMEKRLDKVRSYASSYWLIHVQRSGEVQGDFDSRLLTLLKRFLGSGAETTPSYENWYRFRLRMQRAPPSQLVLQVASFGLHRMLQDLRESVDPNQKNANREPLLAITASVGCASTVQSLLDKKGAEINASSIESPSALHQASYKGQESVVKVLLENGADVDITGGACGNPQQVSSRGGYASILRLLLAHGALVQDGEALVRAAFQGYESTVAILLQASRIGLNDALVEAFERKAAWSQNNNVDKILIMLLEAGAVDPHGMTLIMAAREGYAPVVARLLNEHNAGLDKALISACQQSTKRFYTKTKKQAQRIVVLLLNASRVDQEGQALQAAIENGCKKAANLLRAAAEKKKGRISDIAEGLSNENILLKGASGGSEFQQVALG